MVWPTVILMYVVMWWLSFFAVLPFGQVTQQEAGHVEPGTVPSAPVGLPWARKIVMTSSIAAVLTAAVFAVVTWDLFGFAQ